MELSPHLPRTYGRTAAWMILVRWLSLCHGDGRSSRRMTAAGRCGFSPFKNATCVDPLRRGKARIYVRSESPVPQL